jgi:catalase
MDNIAAAMQGVPTEIVRRQVALFYRVDPAGGASPEMLRQLQALSLVVRTEIAAV